MEELERGMTVHLMPVMLVKSKKQFMVKINFNVANLKQYTFIVYDTGFHIEDVVEKWRVYILLNK